MDITDEHTSTFTGLGAKIYDAQWPEGSVDSDEKFYQRFFDEVPGRILEAACGTGRLLIPYKKQGYQIDGLDNSADMLEICKEKASQSEIEIELFNFPMESFQILNRYKTILVPFHSFSIISDLENAMKALSNFYDHLEENGQLIVSLFLPNYKSLSMHCENTSEWRTRKEIIIGEQTHVEIFDAVLNKPFEQIKEVDYRFDIYKNKIKQNQIIQKMLMRWYFPTEFKLMLSAVNFMDVSTYGNYENRDLRESDTEMIFRAFKRS